MEYDFPYLNRIHSRVTIFSSDLKINDDLYYVFESVSDFIITYKLNQDILSIKDPKIHQTLANHREFLKLRYDLVFPW